MKASLGSVDYIASLFKSEGESKKIKEALTTSAYGSDFVHAALSINNEKVQFFCSMVIMILYVVEELHMRSPNGTVACPNSEKYK